MTLPRGEMPNKQYNILALRKHFDVNTLVAQLMNNSSFLDIQTININCSICLKILLLYVVIIKYLTILTLIDFHSNQFCCRLQQEFGQGLIRLKQ
jgi:hypothetical protein